MKKLQVTLENCYGIKRLNTQIDFTVSRAFAIYAPNGVMKSSFARTFKDLSLGSTSKDLIFPARASSRSILDENDQPVPSERVLVIPPYSEEFGASEKTSTLLVDSRLRKEYEALHADIDETKVRFIKALKAQSKSKKDIEKEISSTFTPSDAEFYRALIRIRDEIETHDPTPYKDVPYDLIFDEKALAALNTKDTKSLIKDYVEKYNELLDKSTYFKKGVFTYYNASQIAKHLADNGFFDAKHTVKLNAGDPLEVTTPAQLEALISSEKAAISNNPELRQRFGDIEKILSKNAQTRGFYEYLSNNEYILASLSNIDALRENLWKSYIAAQKDLYTDLIEKFQAAEKRKREIEAAAESQRTDWETVIDIFNDRFFVPFKLVPKNRLDVILGRSPILSLGFEFNDGAESTQVEHGTLLQALSTGEKKALYILNILFEIEVRSKQSIDTLLIIDDIADSFDYRNKYAIIQYLIDISHRNNFQQIILTHNFDFFRTINSRGLAKYSACLMAEKSPNGISLKQADGIRNVFVNDWKQKFFTDPKKAIACVPFIRNIIEYTRGEGDQDYIRLTSLLHWKPTSSTVLIQHLDAIFTATFGSQGNSRDPNRPVVDLISDTAAACLTATEGMNFENKIILSIAIRLSAERFMIGRISNSALTDNIKAKQTQKLFEIFCSRAAQKATEISTLQRVLLMTPENIHLNSFMYEPIIDMSDDHLRKLYRDVSNLH
jgi:hypothetical protein